MDTTSTAQVDKMSPEEAKVFLRELLDGEAMRSPEVNQHVRKMLRGQRSQVAWFDRMEPGADAECLPAVVRAKPKKPKERKLCVKCNKTPRQKGLKFEGCCAKCSTAAKPLCIKCNETPRQNGFQHEGCCYKCSTFVPRPLFVKCNETPSQGGIHGDRCYKHTAHVPTIELLGDTIDNVDSPVKMALYWLRQNDSEDPEWIEKYVIYIGMMGTTGQAKIDQDEKRMIAAGFMDRKIEQFVTYVELDEFQSSRHDAARDAERYCIREVGLDNLMNSRHGGAGRIPNDTSVGGVFLLVGVKYATRD
jgi:hypothetical protein